MKKDLTEMVFILDRSGSMARMVEDTIGGYNSMIERNREGKGEALVSTVLFDDYSQCIVDRVNIKDVKEMTTEDYQPGGCTALLDTLGYTIEHYKEVHKGLDKSERPDKTLFVITTDGLENASSEYTYKRVKKLITKQKEKHGWEFLFLGADFDAVGEAEKLGIGADRATRFVKDSEGMEILCCDIAETIGNYRTCKKIDDSWAKRTNENFEKRKDI